MIFRSVVVAAAFALFPQILAQETSVKKFSAKELLKHVGDSVVMIEVERTGNKDPKALEPSFFGSPFEKRPEGAYATGTAWTDDGYIVTSYFNVLGDIKRIRVKAPGWDKWMEANLVGYDMAYDLALLKADAKLKPLKTTKSADAGDVVFVVGENPEGDGFNIDDGIISGLGRHFGKFIQTDVKLNYSNTGGPLVNMDGELVGISCKISTKFANTYGQNSGVSFAVITEKLDDIVYNLKRGVKATKSTVPVLGIVFDDSFDAEGVRIKDIQPGSGAEKAGVKAKDIIVGFNGDKVTSFPQLKTLILKKKAGEKVTVKIMRDGKEKSFDVTLGSRDEEE